MKHSKEVVGAGVLVLLSALATFGAGCAAPPSESIEAAGTSAAEGAGRGLRSAGFDVWLREQCPDGRALRLTSEAGKQETACATVRENLLADDAARARLVEAYTAQTEEPTTGEPSGERIGEAKERGVLSGLICGIAVTFALGYQCDRAHLPWSSCAAGNIPPQILCTVIGWTPALP